jgi:hypothetical protein
MVLLDWGKTFDKVLHHRLFEALDRMNVPSDMITALRSLYDEPCFYVQYDWKNLTFCNNELASDKVAHYHHIYSSLS